MIKSAARAVLGVFGYSLVRQHPPHDWGQYDRGLVEIDDRRLQGRSLRKFETPTGIYLLPDEAKADIVSAAIRRGEIFEERIVQMARRFVRPGSTVLDVGANYGQMSVLFSSLVGEHGSVRSFEANPYVCAILEANLAANGIANVAVDPRAVYESSGETLVFPAPDLGDQGSYGCFGVDPRSDQGPRVETIALDDVVTDSPVSFLKIDIQGADLLALRGATRLVRRERMPLVVEYEECFQERFSTSLREYMDFFDSIEYRVDDVYNPYPGSINFLAVPR